MAEAPAHPRHLLGSAWTRCDDAWIYCHWEVVAREGDLVTVRATLDRTHERRLLWRGLRDRSQWIPGWQSRPSPP
jgi:tryptophan-rich hypothetical protein